MNIKEINLQRKPLNYQKRINWSGEDIKVQLITKIAIIFIQEKN